MSQTIRRACEKVLEPVKMGERAALDEANQEVRGRRQPRRRDSRRLHSVLVIPSEGRDDAEVATRTAGLPGPIGERHGTGTSGIR